MVHRKATASFSSSKRIWMLVFSHSSPALSLSVLRNVGGFRLDECSTAVDGRHRFLFLHFSRYAGVTQSEMEIFIRRIQVDRGSSAVNVISIIPANNALDLLSSPGFCFMENLAHQNNRLLCAWKRSSIGCLCILRTLHRKQTKISAESSAGVDEIGRRVRDAICKVRIRREKSTNILPEKSSARIPEQVIGVRRPRGEHSAAIVSAPVPKRRIVNSLAPSRPVIRPPSTLPPVQPPPAYCPTQQHRPTPLRVPSSLPRSFQYVERANDHRWTDGWA